jgi:hypothetical protein
LFWWTSPCDLDITSSYHLPGELKTTWCLSEALPKDASNGVDSDRKRKTRSIIILYSI